MNRTFDVTVKATVSLNCVEVHRCGFEYAATMNGTRLVTGSFMWCLADAVRRAKNGNLDLVINPDSLDVMDLALAPIK